MLKEFRDRVLIPTLVPVAALAIIVVVVLNISRVLIALEERSGPNPVTALAIILASGILFTFTYFWVALNRYNGADGRGLGWFCLFVAVTAVPVTIETDIFGPLRGTLAVPVSGRGDDAGVDWDFSLRLPGLRRDEAVVRRAGRQPRSGSVLAEPAREQMPLEFNEQLVVEYYSR